MSQEQKQPSIEALIAEHEPGHALDQRFYTDPAIFELELDRIITRNWILAGHVSELAEPGDFKVVEVARESAIIVRGKDGSIRAFANVCRHRGSLVCLEESGNTRKFACPYHGWTYDTDGRLIAARSMPDGFDKSGYSLRPVSYGEIHGLMFVCFCDDPPSLDGAVRDLEEPMDLFDFPNLKVAANDDRRLARNFDNLEVPGLGKLGHVPRKNPVTGNDPVEFELVNCGVGVEALVESVSGLVLRDQCFD